MKEGVNHSLKNENAKASTLPSYAPVINSPLSRSSGDGLTSVESIDSFE